MIENKNFLNGRIEVICGSMFSGKTEELIRRIKKVELSNTSFILFKPKKDSRNSKEKIVSHATQFGVQAFRESFAQVVLKK